LAIESRDFAELAAINHGDMWIAAGNGSLNSHLEARMPNTTFTEPVQRSKFQELIYFLFY